MASWRDTIQIPGVTIPTGDTKINAMKGKTIENTASWKTSRQVQAEPNALNKYASYNYVFTLSGLSRDQINKPKSILSDPIHDPIARTGGIGKGNFSQFNSTKYKFSNFTGQDKKTKSATFKDVESVLPGARYADGVLKRGHDIFFEKVNILAVPTPNDQRKLMNFTKIEMELTEPYGVTLFEKLRACAFNNGYIDHVDCPYLLSLEFKGFDSNGLERQVASRRYMPIKITNCEMEITNAGTRYSVTAVPWSEFGATDRYLYNKWSGKAQGNTFSLACKDFSKFLNEKQQKEIDAGVRTLKDKYIITVDPNFENEIRSGTSNFDLEGGLGADPLRFDIPASTSIAKILTDMITQLEPFNDMAKIVKNYWIEYDRLATDAGDTSIEKFPDPMIPWFKIQTSVYVGLAFDGKRKVHQKEIRFHVKPYSIHVMNFTVPGLSANTLWGKYAKKNYKYIFTGENTEIMDLKLYYKYGYFQSRLLDGSRREGNDRDQKDISESSKLENIVKRYTGDAVYPEPLMPLRHEPGFQKAEDTATSDRGPQSTSDEFVDYLTNPRGDMMRVEMLVRGDPAFIGQDMFLPAENNFKFSGDEPVNTEISNEEVARFRGKYFDSNLGCFNYDEAEPLVTLDFRFPTDINENTGLVDFQNLENVQFSGLYKVTQVESMFDGGQFTQNLTMVRFNNQSGDFKAAPVFYEKDQKQSEATQSQNQSGLGGSQETDYDEE